MKKLVYLVPLLAIVGIGFLIPRFLIIKDVRCVSQFGPCAEDVESEITKLRGKNLVDSKEYLKNNLKNQNRVLKYSTRFLLPNRLVVDVVERKAYAAIGVKNSYILIDEEGMVLGTSTSTNLPVVKMDTEIKDEPKVNDKLLLATQLVSDLYSLYSVKSGEIHNDYLQVDQVMGKSVVFPLTGDRDLLIGSIRFILSRLKVESFDPRINLIDLRFKNPVLKYGQK